jgi:D-sedoheptulose 7-phosphate isomerase
MLDYDEIAADYLMVAHEVFHDLKDSVEEVSQAIVASIRSGGKVMFCGNGGSAADAQHFSGEFLNRFLKEREPFAGMTLTSDTSTMTAIANDYSFDDIFSKQIMGLGREGDVLVGITTSGNSPNIVRACEAATQLNIATVAMTGGTGGKLADLADYHLCITGTRHTPRVQEGHQLLMHLICERVEELLTS